MKKNVVLLLVDDEPDLRKNISSWLQFEDFEVIEASGGTEAIKILGLGKIDAIISDIRMPEGDGTEILADIRSKHMRIPVILMTGFSEVSEEALKKQGADHVFYKPFNVATLIETLTRLIEARTHA